METSENVRLWEVLTEIIDLQDKEKLKEFLVNLKSDEFVHAISHLDKDHQTSLLTLLDPENAVEVIEDLPFEQAVQIIEELQTADAAAIINEMSSDDQADFLTDLETEDAEAILIEMAPEDAENVRKLIQYDDDTAGGLMITEFLVFDENKTVNENMALEFTVQGSDPDQEDHNAISF